jgi:hypothetical protein
MIGLLSFIEVIFARSQPTAVLSTVGCWIEGTQKQNRIRKRRGLNLARRAAVDEAPAVV